MTGKLFGLWNRVCVRRQESERVRVGGVGSTDGEGGLRFGRGLGRPWRRVARVSLRSKVKRRERSNLCRERLLGAANGDRPKESTRDTLRLKLACKPGPLKNKWCGTLGVFARSDFRVTRGPPILSATRLSNCHRHALREWLLALRRANLARLPHRRYSCEMQPRPSPESAA